jgi:hypothetical protein
MALGRGSPAENLLMVTEKVNAFAEAAATIAAAGTAHHVVKRYRKKVRANVRRLGCETNGTGLWELLPTPSRHLLQARGLTLSQERRCHQRLSSGSSTSYLRGSSVPSWVKVRPRERPIRHAPEHQYG